MSAVVTSALELAGPAAGGKNNDVTKVREQRRNYPGTG